ncbi:hypothetical protein [Streptomyces sp. RKAG293]|uniref:hypothetical protein n=1 Tax=Streptomyces sp. RKAG293 TaxID=2893403 RepID=UPI002033CFA8|nr:hypothetical protein [Streptomyces sp. RKAG293]MCM2419073.1 hypothetical protein [Streptomyces sp. RKAG293]
MSGQDRAAALRTRREEQHLGGSNSPTPHRTTERPADLVITADMIAAPVAVDASGELTPDEMHQLGVCERAVENLATATWLAGKALHTICNRKLYRHTHTRFDTYVEERWEISARAAYQMIEEWPLAERLTQTMGEPATASHTRALLPVVRRFGLTAATDLYQQIRARAAAEDRRLTATITGQIVRLVLKTAGWPAEETQFQAATRQLMSADALPLTTGSRAERHALTTSTTRPQQPPSPTVQNFADSHEEVTAKPAASMAGSDHDRVQTANGFLGDLASENMLQSILARVIAIEGDISTAALSGSANVEHGGLCRAIVERLTHAAETLRAASG